MALPDFIVAIWVQPHRNHGYFVEIDASGVDDGLPGGVFQSFQHAETQPRHPHFQPDRPHREFPVTAGQVRHLLALADRIRYGFAEHPGTPMLGGASFGLRVARSFQEATIVWYGRFDDQDAAVRDLFEAVQALATP